MKRHHQGKTFLVIEDDADDAALIRLAFDALESCAASICRNLSEAKAYVTGCGMYGDRSKHPFLSAVICDLKLHGESGVEFVAWLKERIEFASLPVFILTGSTSEADISAAKKRGAVSVLIKPAQFEDLRSMVNELAGRLCS